MIKKLLVSSVALAGFSMSQAASVSGDVKFSVDIPEIIVLYHWDTARLNLTGGSAATADTRPHTGSAVLGTGPYNVTTNPISTFPAATSTTGFGQINVKLVNSWGVRSIAANNPKLTLTAPGSTLTRNGGTETLNILNTAADKPVLRCTTGAHCATGNGTDIATIVKGWAVKTGDIEFKLDLSNIAAAGVYSTGGANNATFNLLFETVP